jgi:hypothetical protein
MVISSYYIGGYCWLFDWWLLVAIILVAIVGYLIDGY